MSAAYYSFANEYSTKTFCFYAFSSSKNASSIRSRGVQDFLTFQHYGSVSPPSQKLSAVISALHRICMSSMNLDDFWISTSDLVSELGTLEYPSSVISTAISRVSSHPRFASLSPPAS